MNEDFFLFPWRLHPVLTGVFIFMMTLGAVHLLHKVFKEKSSLPGGFLRTRWVSFWLGDWFVLSFAVFASVAIGGQTARGFQSDWWFQLILFAAGLTIFVGVELLAVIGGGPERLKLALQPSQLWHTVAASVVFYWTAWGFIAVVRDREPVWAFIPAVIFAAGWIATVAYDNVFNPRRSDPVTLDDR